MIVHVAELLTSTPGHSTSVTWAPSPRNRSIEDSMAASTSGCRASKKYRRGTPRRNPVRESSASTWDGVAAQNPTQDLHVAAAARHRSDVIEQPGHRDDVLDAGTSVGAFETDDAALRRGQADRAGRIRAERRRTETRRDRGARTAARA